MYSIDFIRSHELWAVLYTYVFGELTGEISPSVIPRDAIADEITLHVGNCNARVCISACGKSGKFVESRVEF